MKTQMHDYMQNIIEAIKFYTNKLLRKSVANWEQNDSEALDYVKGRTHYVGEEEVTIFPSQTVTYTADNGTVRSYIVPDEDSFELILGNTYDVTFEGTTYEGLVSFYEEDSGNVVIGAPYGDFSNYPFYIWSYAEPDYLLSTIAISSTDTTESHTVEIIEHKQTVHPLDPKYIPDSIARVSDVESALSDSSAAVNEQLDSLRTEITEDLEEKVNVFQGTENADTMLTVDEEGYVTLTPIPDEMDAITLLAERGIVEPAITAAGNVYTNKNGDVYTL